MENFKIIFEREKKKYLLQDNNIIHNFFNYILNDILEDYKISYIFYSLLKDKFIDNQENILQLSLVINIYFIMIDIIFNLPSCLDQDKTNKTASIHKVFNETITTLGIMFSINHLTKIHLQILDKMDTKKTDIINKILPIFDKNVTLINDNIEDEDINNILDNTKNKKNILIKIRIERKKKYLEGLLKYVEILDSRNIFSEEKYNSLCNILSINNTNENNINESIINCLRI